MFGLLVVYACPQKSMTHCIVLTDGLKAAPRRNPGQEPLHPCDLFDGRRDCGPVHGDHALPKDGAADTHHRERHNYPQNVWNRCV